MEPTNSTEVVGMAEAAEIVGVTKSNFSAHRKQFSGEGQCPPATAHLSCGPVWAGKDVKALRTWARTFAAQRVTRNRKPEAEKAEAKAAAKSVKKAAAKPVPAAKKALPAKPVEKAAPAKKAAAPAKKAPAKTASKKGLFGSKSA